MSSELSDRFDDVAGMLEGVGLSHREAYRAWIPEVCTGCRAEATVLKRDGPADESGVWWSTGDGRWLCTKCVNRRHPSVPGSREGARETG